MNNIDDIAKDFMSIFNKMVIGKYAVSVAGSVGKGISDKNSDIDFRLFYEDRIPDKDEWEKLRKEFNEKAVEYKKKGIKIDDFWPRSIKEVDETLDKWIAGEGEPIEFDWTIWGYHTLTDINNQHIIKDDYGIISKWHEKLKEYSAVLKRTTVEKNIKLIKYWRNDYHYKSKVERQDTVFLCGITSKLIHSIMLIVYAINEKYYVGDGNNLKFAQNFKVKPKNFSKRIEDILYPVKSDDMFENQYKQVLEIIDDVINLSNETIGI